MKNSIIITGCEGGIGSELCKYFYKKDFVVIGIDKNITKKSKNFFQFKQDIVGLLNSPSNQIAFTRIINKQLEGTKLIAVINNAAIQIVKKFDKITVDDFELSLRTNVIAPFFLSKIFKKRLDKNYGSIVNIGSIHTNLTKPGFIAYSTSKAALDCLTRSMAVELGKSLKVMGIMPAAIKTNMLKQGLIKSKINLNILKKYHPSDSIGSPSDLAEIIHFMISSNSSFMNGTMINFDGGILSRLHDPI